MRLRASARWRADRKKKMRNHLAARSSTQGRGAPKLKAPPAPAIPGFFPPEAKISAPGSPPGFQAEISGVPLPQLRSGFALLTVTARALPTLKPPKKIFMVPAPGAKKRAAKATRKARRRGSRARGTGRRSSASNRGRPFPRRRVGEAKWQHRPRLRSSRYPQRIHPA